jgi:glycosyltransferase involved in cell wall biosynthesis
MTEISIVMPLYNKAEYVRESIASVLAQTFTRFELIVVDDGSTDSSASIVEAISLPNIRLIRQSNQGVSAARNRGMREAAADWIAFIDADDLWLNDHLTQLWKLHEVFPEAMLVANDYSTTAAKSHPPVADVSRRVTARFIDEAARGEAWVFTSATMVHKDVALRTGGFAEGESRGEDVDLWIRMALEYPVAFSSYVGTIYRQVPSSLTASTTVLEPDIAMRHIVQQISGDKGLAPELRGAMLELANRLALAHATDCLLRGQKAAASRFIDGARKTRYWAARRRFLAVLSLLPVPAIRALLALKGILN